jgi:phage shock protein PspC (stress-responsive transcriptional regulator)
MIKRRLKRSKQDRMIGGICGGLGDYFSIDPLIFRIIFIVGSISPYPFILIYIILWIITPFDDIEIKYNKQDKFSNE